MNGSISCRAIVVNTAQAARCLSATALLSIASGIACGQDFTAKPLRMITSAPGGGSDTTSRIIARALTENVGQQVVVDNRGNFGGEVLARSTPDGYTVLLDGFSLWLGAVLQRLTYDPVLFTPVTVATKAPNVIVVNASLPVKSVKDLIGLAKARPGVLNYSSGGIGGTAHLGGELFKSMAGVKIVNVNYAGTGQALNAVLGNEVQMMVANVMIATPHIKSGKLTGLAVGSLQPSPLIPDLPTVSASGLPGYESVTLLLIAAPPHTPGATVNRLNRDIVRVLNRPDIRERLLGIGVEAVGSTPQETAATIRSELTKWTKIIKEAGITPNS